MAGIFLIAEYYFFDTISPVLPLPFLAQQVEKKNDLDNTFPLISLEINVRAASSDG